MSFTTITKSGKTIEMGDGITKITSMKNGKKITKVYHMPKMHAGTVHEGPGEVNLKSAANNSSQPPNIRHQPPNATGRRLIKNQFNIQDSVIGQVAIGNRGPTYFNQSSHTYQPGSTHTDFNITGGNFTQANLGGEATYNNKNATVSAGSGGGGQKSIDDLITSDQEAENQVWRILMKEITIEQFTALLNKGFTLQKIDDALKTNVKVELMINSMLQSDTNDIDDDDDE